MSLSWSGAFSWRMRRQPLEPVGTASVAGVVRRLGAVPAYPAPAAELSRSGAPGPDRVRWPARWQTGASSRRTVPRRHPPADARGRRRVPRAAGSQPNVGAAQLAELLRSAARGLAALSECGPGGAGPGPMTREEL
jgi:hypothetical protein